MRLDAAEGHGDIPRLKDQPDRSELPRLQWDFHSAVRADAQWPGAVFQGIDQRSRLHAGNWHTQFHGARLARNPHVRGGVRGNRLGKSGLNTLRIEGGDFRESMRQGGDFSRGFSDESVGALTQVRCPLRWDYCA